MKTVFEHIEHIRYLLAQIFECGFSLARNISPELEDGAEASADMGMSGGAALLRELGAKLTAFAAGQETISAVSAAYCNAVSYYNMSADMVIIETMAGKF